MQDSSSSFAGAATRSVLHFTTIYTSLQSQKCDLNIEILNLIQLNCLITFQYYTMFHFYNTCLNSLNTSSRFSCGIIVSSLGFVFLTFSSYRLDFIS